jgi:hypothetical protein
MENEQFCAGIGVIGPMRDSRVSAAEGRMRVFKSPTMPNGIGGVMDAVELGTRFLSLMLEALSCLAGGARLAIDLNRAGVTSPTISCRGEPRRRATEHRSKRFF